MDSSARGKKLERTLTGDYVDPVRAAECDGSGADRACAHAPVHPDQADAGASAVGDYGFGDFRGSDQEGCFNGRSHVFDAGEAGMAKYVGGMGIYENDVIAAAAEFLE